MHRIRSNEHQFIDTRDVCIWCGMTREQIEELGERVCPRREPRDDEEQ